MELYCYQVHAIKILIMFYLVEGLHIAISKKISKFIRILLRTKKCDPGQWKTCPKKSIAVLVYFSGGGITDFNG